MKPALLFVFLFPLLPVTAEPAPERILLREDFSDPDAGLAKRLLDHPAVTRVEDGGVDGSAGIRVAYEGYEHGSERVVVHYSLPRKTTRATLSFDVLFEEDFQWVRGGKLHGLGPEKPVTGGSRRRADGWSARTMFKAEGKIATYLYDQDREKKWGYGQTGAAPVFRKNRWHHLELSMVLNDPGEENGGAVIRIDGENVVETEGVEYRGAGDEATRIERLLFSTFHGGNTPDWAPVDAEGNPVTVHARFDNFRVVDDP